MLAQPFLPSFILVTSLAIVGTGAFKTFSDSMREHRSEFRGMAAERTSVIMGGLVRYGLALQGLQAHVSASSPMTRAQFHEYVRGLDIATNYPGMGIVAFARRVPGPDKVAFEHAVRGDRSLRLEGYPEYAIKPPGERLEYVPTDFQEPWEPHQHVHGLDLAGDPTRKAGLELARDTGRLVFTDVFPLAISGEQELGFSMRLPVYMRGKPLASVDERRGAFLGVVTAGVRPAALIRDLVLEEYLRTVRLRIIDGGRFDGNNDPQWRAKVVYDSAGISHQDRDSVFTADLGEIWFKELFEREIGGRRWYFEFSEKPGMLPTHVIEPALIILLSGCAISLLLFRLVGTLARSRDQAVEQVSQVTEDLANSRQSLQRSRRLTMELVEALPNPVAFEDAQGRYLDVNRAWERMFAVPRSAVRGKLPAELGLHVFPSRGYVETMAPIGVRRPVEGQREITIRRSDGSRRDFVVVTAAIGGATGGDVYSVNILIDITERRRAELRRSIEHRVTTTLVNATDAESAMHEIVCSVCRAMGWAWASRWIRDQHEGIFRCVQGYSAEARIDSSCFAQLTRGASLAAFPTGAVADALDRKTIVQYDDIPTSSDRDAAARAAGLRQAVAVPITVSDEVWEMLEFFSTDQQPIEPWMLESLRTIAMQIAMFATRKQAEAGLAHLAAHDSLTQLPNRGHFTRILGHAIAGAKLKGGELSLMFVDLDRFKFINDALGHEAGDQVLVQVASRLVEVVRSTDTVARLGGDEFVVLLQGVGPGPDLERVAEKIVLAVSRPMDVQGREYQLTASLGVSAFPHHGEHPEVLLKRSDVAMYEAKQAGRNNFRVYDATMDRNNPRRLALEAALRRAVEANELSLHFQPKIGLADGSIAGAEALVRWESREHGPVSPGEFIPIAEDTGMIVEIGAWVMHEACRQMSAWKRQGLTVPSIAVNLSPLQFAHDVPTLVARALAQSGLDPACVEVEITESAVMREPEKSVAIMKELKALGVSLSIDDFGTGYSSLGHLKRFPFNSVKLDRSFVMDLPGDADSCQITRAVVAMARSLHLRTVAEGVETAEQLAFLASEGCDEAQGYYFSKPLPAQAFTRFVRRWEPTRASGGASSQWPEVRANAA